MDNSFSLKETDYFMKLLGNKVMTLVARTLTQFTVRVNNTPAWFAFKLQLFLKFCDSIL
jgi:hypothetical protein